MNINATAINKGAKMPKYHVKIAVEVLHKLEGALPKEHNTNLRNCLRRAKETDMRLKLEKSTIFENKVDWFRRVFSSTRVSASGDKIIIEEELYTFFFKAIEQTHPHDHKHCDL